MAVRLSTLTILISIFLRYSVSLYGYSGENDPPMHGDYEAQRHWMEITYNLPVEEWYFNTTENDLEFWGLDYPPLTAYHSWICGFVAHFLNPKYVELFTSRGYESSSHKIFMRYTVLIFDLVTFVAASYVYSKKTRQISRQHQADQDIELLLLLTFPGIILIDHGHFQYNCISLGLALFSIYFTKTGHDISSAIFFCLSLSYKQMILYYSMPIFFYYLGLCKENYVKLGPLSCFKKFLSLSVAVVISLALIWLPFVIDLRQLSQVVHRIFPFARGVFEDKVANIWCLFNIVIKFRRFLGNGKIAIICIVLTASFCTPSCRNLFKNPSIENYLFSLINCSLAFFLFSYQVHEKTILLVALPVMLCFKKEPLHCFWFLNIATFSMLPLLIKDNLIIPYLSLSIIFNLSVYAICFTKDFCIFKLENRFLQFIFPLSLTVSVVLTICTLVLEPPVRYPDLYSLLIAAFCALHNLYFLIHFNLAQLNLHVKLKSN